MRRNAIQRLLIAGTLALTATLAPFLGQSAAIAEPPASSMPSTTVFQIPITFFSGCGVGFRCYIPPVVPLFPTATTEPPGAVTFQLSRPTAYTIDTFDCIGVSVNWRNLTTGATGTAEVRRVPLDYSAPIAAEDWCRYTPATVFTGSGLVTATATAGDPDHRPVSAGAAVFLVP
ncbi:hypothetical protein [Rhodococcus qingshengii]|uniref:hypothetical protein n=1 Tax=Rhodococcus qingshengii TaxID=334542 RepID=UPI001BE7EF79|nr:hypothetical protein [Rhodococcus qingshengii]MBT2272192.1 hypothetical protein [Rhodococcus qingshengii]